MYLFTDRMYQKEEFILDESKKQVIFTTVGQQMVIDWLIAQGFPESFIEDIQNKDHSISFQLHEIFRLIILKYFVQDDEDELLYGGENIIIIAADNTLLFLCHSDTILQDVIAILSTRYQENDSLEYITYTIVDIMVDNTMSIIDHIDDRLEEIEDDIFSENIEEDNVQKHLYFTRRTLNRITKHSVHSTDIVNKIYNHLSKTERKNLKYEFIDLKEHLNFSINESKTYLDRTGYLQNLLMGFLSNRMNKSMQRLAAISLIFLPLTFIVGNYGMNFQNMPELDWKYSYLLVWILNIVIALTIFRWIKKQKWI